MALLEKDAIAELTFDIAAISVACALGCIDLRAANPQLAAWYFEASQRPSMIATMPKVVIYFDILVGTRKNFGQKILKKFVARNKC